MFPPQQGLNGIDFFMPNDYFRFKKFLVKQDRSAMKVTTDSCLFGAWTADQLKELPVSTILDIGTGTGLLALMIAQKNNSSIDAVELDPEAAAEAHENVKATAWHNRISVFNGDIKNVLVPGKKYDVIVSNPPFYENEIESSDTRKNIAHHQGGLLFNELVSIFKKHLAPAGKFYIMIAAKRSKEVLAHLNKNDLPVNKLIQVKQTPGHPAFRIFIGGQKDNGGENVYTEETITIRDEKNEYTPGFIELLKDYYLKL